MWLIFVVSLISLTPWPSDNDVLDPEVQASVDFAAQERRATPPKGQLVTFFCFVFCSYNFLCFFFRCIDWAPPAPPEGQLVTFFVLFFALTIFFSISFVWTSQWENRVPQISDCFAAKTCYFYFLFGLCFRVDDFHFDCLCYSWFYKFPFHVIEVFDEKRDSHQSQMISRNSPDVHQTKREPVNYPNCFTQSAFFIFYIYCIACSINL